MLTRPAFAAGLLLLLPLFAGLTALADYPGEVLSDNPAGYWRMNYAPPPPVVTNSSASGAVNNGTPATTLVCGQPGAIAGDADTSMRFNGSSAKIDVAYDAALNPSSFTVECWANVQGGGGTYRSPITSRESITGTSAGYLFYAANTSPGNRWEFWTGTGGSTWNAFVATNSVATTNVWTHLVGTYDAATLTMSFYVDGALVMQSNNIVMAPVGTVGNARPLRIGSGNTEGAGANWFNGFVDEVAVYPSALSDAKVLAHYQAGTNGSGTYYQTVTNDLPAGYWRVDEPQSILAAPDVAANSGSAGTNARLSILNGVLRQTPGALAASNDKAMRFDGSNDKLETTFNAALNPANTVSVECWANLTGVSNAFRTLVASTNQVSTSNRRGYVLWADNNNRWAFRVASGSTAISVTASNLAQYGVWTHLVGVHDGTQAHLFVNGVEATNPVTCAYAPNTNAASMFRIGAAGTQATGNGDSFFHGSIDEVVVYSNALSAAQILAHYQNATNSSPGTPYETLILGANPVGYWRLGEGLPTYAATNLGWAGNRADGAFFDGTTPGNAGVVAGDTALKFNGASKLEIPHHSAFASPQFTAESWFNETSGSSVSAYGAPFSARDDYPTGASRGFILYRNPSGANYQFWTGTGGAWHTIAGGSPSQGAWHHLVGTFDGTLKSLYLDGVLVGLSTGSVGYQPNTQRHLNLGAGANESYAGNFFFNGLVDEVAFYTNALPAQRIIAHYKTATGSDPTPTAPVFVKQPQSVTNYEGSTVTLSAALRGSLPFYYQWLKDGVDVAGQTNATLVISNVLVANTGDYTLVVTNDAAIPVISDVARTEILAAPPIINTQPVNASRYAGASVSFSVDTGGSLPLSYQWLSNGVSLGGATGTSLTLTNLQLSFAADYSVRITNSAGLLLSSNATLTVLATTPGSMTAVVVADRPVAFWKLGETNYAPVAFDYVGGHDGAYLGGYQQGQPGAILGDPDLAVGFDAGSASVQVPYSPALNPSTAFSVECWARPIEWYTGMVQPMVSSRDTIANGVWTFGYELRLGADNRWQWLTGKLAGSAWDSLIGPDATTNAWTHVVATMNGLEKKLYVNGALVASGTAPAFAVNGGSGLVKDLALGANFNGDGLATRYFGGDLDEIAIYNYEFSPAQVSQHYAVGGPPALSITSSAGNVIVTWTKGLLLEAESLSGPWTTNSLATSPYTNAPTGMKFYRALFP